jgi:hypothetical protein
MLTTRMFRELAAKTNFQRATPGGGPSGTGMTTEDRTNHDQVRSEPSGSIYQK